MASKVDEDTQPISAEEIDIRIQSTNSQQQNDRTPTVEQTTSDGNDENQGQRHEQSDTLGPRRRIATERGRSEKIDRLRQRRITALSAVTRQRNALSPLMTDSNDLHLVKFELSHLEELFSEYRKACESHLKELVDDKVKQAEIEHNKLKDTEIVMYLSQVSSWITEAEHNLSDRLESLSSKASDRTRASHRSRASKTKSKASSRSSKLSARKQERVKLAELMVERSMLKKKQALKNAEEDLKLEIEIEKAEARERTLAEMSDDELSDKTRLPDQASVASDVTSISKTSGSSFQQLPTRRLPPTLQTANQPCETSHNVTERRSVMRSHTSPQRHDHPTSRQEVRSTLNDRLFGNELSTSVKPTSPSKGNNVNNETKSVLEGMMLLQQRQTETLIATHQQLTASMTLPQSSISIFRGDPLEYRTFVTSFDARIQHRVHNKADLLYYLNQYLTGELKDLIEGCLHMDPDEGYTEARRLLKKEYGDPYKISMAYIQKILSWPAIKSDEGKALKSFSLFLIKCKTAMKSISYLRVLDHAPNMQAVVSKLPFHLQAKWRDLVAKIRRDNAKIANFENLTNFIQSAADAANDPVFGKDALSKSKENPKRFEKRDGSQSKNKNFSFVTNPVLVHGTGSENQNIVCPLCNSSHDLDDCQTFLKKTVEQRKEYLKQNKMCFACYEKNHIAKGCLQKRKCKKCNKPHPSALHIEDFKLDNQDHENKEEVKSACTKLPPNSLDDVVIVHAIIPVKVKRKGGTATVTTYAFYDNGSGGCFLTESLQEQLGAQGRNTKLQLGTMLGCNLVDSTIVEDLVVTDMKDANPVEIPRLYTRTEIPVTEKQIPTPGMMKRWQHLHEIAKLIPEFQPGLEIGLLIGSNCPAALEPLEVVPSHGEGPFAMRLRHGWTLNGPLSIINTSQTDISCHRIVVREANDTVKEVPSPQAIRSMFEMDFNDCKVGPDERSLSQEDKQFLTKMDDGIRLINGHYETPLPFRNPEVILPNNRSQALKRALWQKKKMQRDTKYHRDYCEFMNEIIRHGYARKIPESEVYPVSGKVWYVPHHGVYQHKKLEKIRVVFDCSADYAGTSLNKSLLQGPNLTNSLIGVLTRFRKEPIAFMADVEAMFHQVRVPKEQWNYLRFLWWPEGNLDGEMEEYQMVVHLFGAVSSPSCCNYALRKTATDNESDYPVVAEIIRRNFYVD